ncbi:MAG: hypothetical protein AAGB48_02180 [Planctomycetota bacterium]
MNTTTESKKTDPKLLALGAPFLALAIAMAGCEQSGDGDAAAETESAVESAADAAGDAAEGAGEAIEDAAEGAQEAAEDAGDAVEDAVTGG